MTTLKNVPVDWVGKTERNAANTFHIHLVERDSEMETNDEGVLEKIAVKAAYEPNKNGSLF